MVRKLSCDDDGFCDGARLWDDQGRWTVPKSKNVEKPQDGRQKSCQNIGNPYQMEDNKAASSAPPFGVRVVFHLVMISDVLA